MTRPKSRCLRTVILCLLCAFGLVAGWTLKSWGAVPSGYRPDGSLCLWPNGIIPYVIDDNVPEREAMEVLKAIRMWDTKTVLQFVEREPHHEDYLRFTLGPAVGTWKCREGGPGEQVKVVEQPDSAANLLHGLGHAIGLEHEQQRRDRDRWLTVFSDNIAATPLARDAWHPRPGFGPDIGPYDYRSIMHYHFMERMKQRNHARPFMAETIPPGIPFGAKSELSPGDVDSVARLYGHIPDEHVISTNPAGLEIIVDGERMTAPASFAWETGSEHTLEVPSPQFGDGARFLFGRWSDDGARTHTITATDDTTLYQANFIAQHQVSTTVDPPDAGSVVVSPASPDGYYTLRSPVEVSATPTPDSAFRFLRWAVEGDHWWSWFWIHMHGEASNPARTHVGPGLVYHASFGDGPIFRVDSNVDPVPVIVDGWERRTPVAFDADRFSGSTTVTPRLIESWGRAYRHRFRSWSDGGDETHTIDVPQDTDTTLTLTLDTEYRLTTRAWQDWHGNQVRPTPSLEDGFYPEGTEVRLLAVAKPPAKFLGWSGDVSGRNPAAVVVIDDGQLAEAVFVLDSTELQTDAPVEVSLRGVRWDGRVPDFARYYVQPPPDASEIEVEFLTRVATPGEAGLFVADTDLWPNWVHQDTADSVLRAGEVSTLTIPRPPNGWPVAYSILIRAAEVAGAGTQTLEGTLVARVNEIADTTPDPDLCRDHGPCGVGQGDCDPGQCADGLVCATDVGPQYGLPAIYDVCELPGGSSTPDPHLCRDYGPCGVGQGDCDPGQCADGLVCATDVGPQYGLPAIYDVCQMPNSSITQAPDPHFCASGGPNYPCEAGEGDCDPGQCADGLVCATDVGPQYGLPANYDVCELPQG